MPRYFVKAYNTPSGEERYRVSRQDGSYTRALKQGFVEEEAAAKWLSRYKNVKAAKPEPQAERDRRRREFAMKYDRRRSKTAIPVDRVHGIATPPHSQVHHFPTGRGTSSWLHAALR